MNKEASRAPVECRVRPIGIVILVSGGKDSQLCVKLAIETGQYCLGLFCDTGFEHPKTYAHIKKISDIYNIEIETLKENLESHIISKRAFPAPFQRSCSSRLKTRPTSKFLVGLARKQGGFEVWFGMRTGESKSRADRYAGFSPNELFDPNDLSHDYPKLLGKLGVKFRLPIVHLSDEEVFAALQGQENPLYKEGFSRVGCFPCLATSAKEHNRAFLHDEFGAQQKRRLIRIEDAIGKKHSPANTGQMCLFCNI